MTVPEGAIVCVAMDWGDKPEPSPAELARMWPEHKVAEFPRDKVQVSNAIVWCAKPTTGQALQLPAIKAGAKRVLIYRADKVPIKDKSGFPTLDGDALLNELVRYWRAFGIPGVIVKPPADKEKDPPFLESPKKVAIAIGAVAAVTGLVLVAMHFARG
jgi:hypothetical protein